MDNSRSTILCQAERDTRRAFQFVLNRLAIILEKKYFSDFQEEQVRQLTLEFKDAFAKWKYRAPQNAHAFQHRMKSTQAWALLETPTSQLRPWIRAEIGNSQMLSVENNYLS